jgi:hypothetical protein
MYLKLAWSLGFDQDGSKGDNRIEQLEGQLVFYHLRLLTSSIPFGKLEELPSDQINCFIEG